MKGNFCKVVMMTFAVSPASASANCEEDSSIFFTTPTVWSNWKIVSWS